MQKRWRRKSDEYNTRTKILMEGLSTELPTPRYIRKTAVRASVALWKSNAFIGIGRITRVLRGNSRYTIDCLSMILEDLGCIFSLPAVSLSAPFLASFIARATWRTLTPRERIISMMNFDTCVWSVQSPIYVRMREHGSFLTIHLKLMRVPQKTILCGRDTDKQRLKGLIINE